MLIHISEFLVGLGLVIYCAEKLVKGVVETSMSFGISTFLISVIFIGFDPDNLSVGAVGSFEGVAGIALGSVIGATMVTAALAFGITILFVPMRFEQIPKRILAVPILAVLLLGVLGVDGQLSRIDGGVLLLSFVLSVVYLLRLGKRGLDVKPKGELAATLGNTETLKKWKSFGFLLISLVGIIIGSEMLVRASVPILGDLGLSDTVFGMTILALLVSIEELARELPAAVKGRPEISFGNVIGSILAFFLFNAGIIALISPVKVSAQVYNFYFPLCFVTIVVLSLLMTKNEIPRWAGGILILLYLVFVIEGYVG